MTFAFEYHFARHSSVVLGTKSQFDNWLCCEMSTKPCVTRITMIRPQLATVRALNRAYYQTLSLKLSLARLGPPAFKLNLSLVHLGSPAFKA